MALPTLSRRNNWPVSRNLHMHTSLQRRCREEESRRQWEITNRFFQTENMKAEKIQKWTSDDFYRRSFDSHKDESAKEIKEIRLKRRRAKLSEMLHKESVQHEAELKCMTPRTTRALLDDMKERVDTLQSAREEKRKQLAEEKMLEHWQLNNPDIQQIDRELFEDHVISGWKDQVEEHEQQAEVDRKEAEMFSQLVAEQAAAAAEEERAAETKRLEQQKSLQEILKRQMVDLRRREAEAAMFREQQKQIEKERLQMEILESTRRKLEANRKKQDFGRVLLRQHKTQMQCRARRVREELEEDRKLLELLVAREVELDKVQTSRRVEARADAQWMKDVIEEQLKLEKVREAELEQLFEEEAARMWHKRESEWEREKQARENLMIEVLNSRQEQMEAKLEGLRELQQESLQQREELLHDMEMAQQLTRREQERAETARSEQRQNLEEQITSQQQALESTRLVEKLELDQEKIDKEMHDEAVQEETERRRQRGYTPRNYGRRNAWM